jgi:hypothetical protein
MGGGKEMKRTECDCCCECCEEKPVKVYFCPKCKSVDVKYVFGFGNLFGVVPRMKCSKCGFHAVVFPQLVKLKKEDEKIINKKFKAKKGGSHRDNPKGLRK